MQFNNKTCINVVFSVEISYLWIQILTEMNELAKWVWIVIIVILFVGTDILWIVGAAVVVGLLVLWIKPEWYDKIKK